MDIRIKRKLWLAVLAATGASLGATIALGAGTQNASTSTTQDQGTTTTVDSAKPAKHRTHSMHAKHHAQGARSSDDRMSSAPANGTRMANNEVKGESAADVLFDRLDLNHDGRLSHAEMQHDRHLAARARSLDRDHDGTLSRDELAGYRLGGQ